MWSTTLAHGPVTNWAVTLPGTMGCGCVGTRDFAFSTAEPTRSSFCTGLAAGN